MAYLIPEDDVRKIETIDHEVCLSKGLEITDNYSRRMYWQCRLNLIKERISDVDRNNGRNKFYVTELKRIKNVIENYMQKIQNDIDYGDDYNREHDDVVLRKYDAYYYNLLHFGEIDYNVEKVNDRSEIEEIIEVREILSKKNKEDELKDSLKKFPECITYDIGSDEFKKCIEIKNSIEQCRLSVEGKIKEESLKDRFYCKKISVEKYPDHLALYNSEYEELKSKKHDEFTINRSKEEAVQRRLVELNNLMSGPRLSPVQLINLRKFEEKKCLMDKQLENNMSKILLYGECENIALLKYKNINGGNSGANSSGKNDNK